MSAANQIIEIANPAYLKTRHQQLIIEQDGDITGSFPVEDLHALILCHPQITITHGVLERCLRENVPIIVCNEKFLPAGLLLASSCHSLHGKIIRHQAQASLPLKKQVWRQIVMAKIRAQSIALEQFDTQATRLSRMAAQVKSGDSDNLEAQAAAWYWPRLMGSNFRRNPDQDGANTLLNYGYAILRASTARAIVGAGLNPALGVFHHNQYNPHCLADDLMEPARPMVDMRVRELTDKGESQLTRQTKTHLLEIIHQEVSFAGQHFYLAHALQRSAKSLASAVQQNDPKLFMPVDPKS